ncbi:MAG: DnaJ domain-containing protein [Treponema sp.]|nr:DnaJ domain-containing protein [Treponema sp.]
MNYYELLNIERGADAGEIKRAYFSAVKIHSPDSDPEGFKALRTAYETLSDNKKRAEYDGYFTAASAASGGLQNDILAARELIRENKYKQAADFLAELSGKNPDSDEVKRLLAEVLLYLRKSGTADKICEEILEKNPSDCETLLLRAKIAESRKHVDKANDYYNDAVNADPLNSKAWIAYMRYSLHDARWQISDIFRRAMEQDINMFRDEYLFYIVGTYNEDLFSDKNDLQYYDKFAEYFVNDKNPDKEIYSHLMNLMPRFLEKAELVPFVEKILPLLENSKQYKDEDEKNFKYIHAFIMVQKLKTDKRIHDVLVDLTIFLLSEDEDKNEQLEMEIYITYHLPELRRSIKVLLKEYPDFFRLNQSFYLDVLNEKREAFLLDKYAAIHKKLRGSDGIFYDGDFDDAEDAVPYKRESPKIGRNDPCPCGSGKKYKKCCGAG